MLGMVEFGIIIFIIIFCVVIFFGFAFGCQMVANGFLTGHNAVVFSKNIRSKKEIEKQLVEGTTYIGNLVIDNDTINVQIYDMGFGYIPYLTGQIRKNSNKQFVVDFRHTIHTSYSVNLLVACLFPLGIAFLWPAYSCHENIKAALFTMNMKQIKQ